MQLEDFFRANPRAALALSGGSSSAFLLWSAREHGCQVHAYYVRSAFQPVFELENAKRLAGELGVPITVLEMDILSVPGAAANGRDRCYHCKRALFTRLWEAARRDGYPLLLEGTNASDGAEGCPSMRALEESAVRSPLRECGIAKDEVRRRSREAGLFTCDKPAYACLATRVPAGTAITSETLQKVELAEALLAGKGFTDFRVRLYGGAARIQVPRRQIDRVLFLRYELLEVLSPLFDAVFLDLESRSEAM